MNPFPNKPWCLRVCCTNLLKTLWEKEKLLVTSNFSFSHRGIFYRFEELSTIFIKFEIIVCKLFQFGRVYNLSFGKGLTYIYVHYKAEKKYESGKRIYPQVPRTTMIELKTKS